MNRLLARLPLLITLSAVLAMLAHAPIAQLANYHVFADQRTGIGLPCVADVLSNAGFALLGLWGLARLWPRRREPAIQVGWPGYCLFLIALTLTAVGSSYLLVQGLPIILVPLWQAIHRAPAADRRSFAIALLLYVVAKAAELHDHELFEILGWISGHTLKHVLATGAAAVLVNRLVQRVREAAKPERVNGAQCLPTVREKPQWSAADSCPSG